MTYRIRKGDQFGQWTVVKDRIEAKDPVQAVCACGTTSIGPLSRFKTSPSCGCMRVFTPRGDRPPKNVEKTYGAWTVLSAPYKLNMTYVVRAVCACGTEREVHLTSMKSGRSHSCGCQQPSAVTDTYHGTPGGYSNQQCRCDFCTVAWNAYCKGRKSVKHNERQRGVATDIGGTDHGTETGYQRGCGCAPCRLAHNGGVLERTAVRLFRSTEAFKAMWAECSGLCMCCERNEAVVVDHVHGTQTIRGLLCHGCNTGLGKLGDSVQGLERALKYLRSV